MSTVQAIFSCIAGFMVCRSSCARSFLTASHFMSDSYAWFGCAYFLYDMWSMYEVYVQKIADKLDLQKVDGGDNCRLLLAATTSSSPPPPPPTMYDKLLTDHNNGIIEGSTIKSKDNFYDAAAAADAEQHLSDTRRFFAKRLAKVPTKVPSFIWYCLSNPVMTIHHIFIGSFGLMVIVVSATFLFFIVLMRDLL